MLDDFAKAALTGLLSYEPWVMFDAARTAYNFAEAMLAERERRRMQSFSDVGADNKRD